MPITFAMSSLSCMKSRVSGPSGGAERPAAGQLRYCTSILISLGLTDSTFGGDLWMPLDLSASNLYMLSLYLSR